MLINNLTNWLSRVCLSFFRLQFIEDHIAQVLNRNTHLLHRVAVAHGDGVVDQGVVIDGDAHRRADGILSSVTFADGVLLLILAHEVELQHVDDLACFLRQAVFLDQRQHCDLVGCKDGRQLQHHALRTVFQLLLGVGVAEHGEEHTVEADGSLDDVRRVALVGVGVEVLELLARVFGMGGEVEVGAAVDAFQLLEAEGEVEFDVSGCVGIMGQLLVIVEAVFFSRQT